MYNLIYKSSTKLQFITVIYYIYMCVYTYILMSYTCKKIDLSCCIKTKFILFRRNPIHLNKKPGVLINIKDIRNNKNF